MGRYEISYTRQPGQLPPALPAPPAGTIIMPTSGYTGNKNLWHRPVHPDFARKNATSWAAQMTFQAVATPAAPIVMALVGRRGNALVLAYGISSARSFSLHEAGVGDIVASPDLANGSEHKMTVSWSFNDSLTIYQGETSVATGSRAGTLGTTGASADILGIGSDNEGLDRADEAEVIIRDFKLWQGQSVQTTVAELESQSPTVHIPISELVS